MGQEMRNTIGLLITEFIRPMAQQSRLNQQLVESNARAIEANTHNIAATNTGINELKESVELLTKSTDDAANEALTLERIANGNVQRFDILLAEAREDRKRLDAALGELAAQRESMQALLSALANTNGRVDSLEQAS